jgi:transposase
MAETNSYQLFVGIDIAYKTFSLATLSPHSKAKAEANPLPQSQPGFSQLSTKLLSGGLAPEQILVVMEATSTYWINLALHLHEKGFALSVVNPTQAHHFAQAVLRRVKTDQLDALTLAQLAKALSDQLKLWSPPPALYHELQQRLNQRQALLTIRQQLQNQLHALSAGAVVIEAVAHRQEVLITSLQAQLEELQAEIQQLFSQESEWAKSIALLQTIPGIGLLTACWLVAATLNFSTCSRPEELVRYIGLAPLEYSSGSSIHKRPQIGRAGQPVLRSLLYMGSLSAARFNPPVKALAERLKQAGKASKLNHCACARKLAILAFAIVKSGKAFDPKQFERIVEAKRAQVSA